MEIILFALRLVLVYDAALNSDTQRNRGGIDYF